MPPVPPTYTREAPKGPWCLTEGQTGGGGGRSAYRCYPDGSHPPLRCGVQEALRRLRPLPSGPRLFLYLGQLSALTFKFMICLFKNERKHS